MKTLFYNPMELPSKIHIVSKVFGIDIIYEEPYNNVDFSIAFDELFNMAQCDCFDQVEVYITSHVQAYLRPNKNSHEKTDVIGWISLKGIKNGGGYLQDKNNNFYID